MYDICRLFVQFVMPLLVVLGVYISIFWRLKSRPMSQHSQNHKRRRRTNIMIISVSITFFLSWLPLNALNFFLDLKADDIQVRFKKGIWICIQKFLHFFRSMEKSKELIQWFTACALLWDWATLALIPYYMDTWTKISEESTKIFLTKFHGIAV